MFAETECDGVMIGRGAMGNPWLFDEIRSALENKEFFSPTKEEKAEMAIYQLGEMIKEKGDRIGIAEGKKHMAWYINGMSGAALARNRIMMAMSFAEIKDILNELVLNQ